MKISRREFVGLMGATAALLSVPNSGYSGSSVESSEVIERGGWQLKVMPTGDIVSLRDGNLELVNRKVGDNHPRILMVGKKLYTCNQPRSARREGLKLVFEYAFSDRYNFSVDYEIELIGLKAGAVALKQKVGMRFPAKVADNVKLVLPRNLQLPLENRKVFVPLKNGIGRRKPVLGLENDDEYLFRFAGSYEGGRPQMLAIPMLDEYADGSDVHLTLCADPFFTSHFVLPFQGKIGQFHCLYLGQVGLHGREERTIYTGLHRGDEKTAIQVFYDTVLADVKPGADWLHDVAMIDYDYLSENGQGWFADIDKLEQVVRSADRSKVFLALHGWYDCVGRYTFDYRTRSLDKKWIAFPSALNPDVQALGDAPETWTENYWHKASVAKMRPVEMTLADMHRRIKYAKDRGFRVGLYYADGLAVGDTVKDIYDPSKVLHWGGWEGPDTKGRVCQQSPLHPEVRDFYRGYLQALLAEYGKEVDGFIWDETFFIDPGDLGTPAYTGYADRAMMTLVKELAAMVADFSPQLVFFASDVIGVRTWVHKAPYALVAHATYQDSGSRPEAWPYGLFPNFRNVLWSCNWAPVSNFHYTQYAVETFDTPVTISNGAAGDDIGISEVNPPQLKRILDLFEKRKNRRMEISWIEENQCNHTYRGREIKYKWTLRGDGL